MGCSRESRKRREGGAWHRVVRRGIGVTLASAVWTLPVAAANERFASPATGDRLAQASAGGERTSPLPGTERVVALQSGERLTLERAIALAESASPRLAVASARAEGAGAGVLTARAYPNPTTEFDLGGQRARSDGTRGGALSGIGIHQPIDLPSVRNPRIDAAQANADAGRLELAEARIALRADVRQAFHAVLVRRAELALAEDNQRLLEDIRGRVAVRVDVGEAPRFELTRADAELLVAQNAATSARLRVDDALARLRAAIGAPGLDALDVEGVLTPSPTLPPLAALREEVLARSPALARSAFEVRRAESRLAVERALRAPQPAVRAGLVQDPDTFQARVGLALQVPLWNRREGQIGEASAALRETAAAGAARRVDVLLALDAAWSRHQVASRQIAAFEGGLLRQAEAALSVAQSAWRFGERGFIEVLDAQRVLRAVRLDYLAARAEQGAALIEIERLRATTEG